MRFLVSRIYAVTVFAVVFWLLYAEFIAARQGLFGSWGAIPLAITALVAIVLARMSTDDVMDWGNGRPWSKRCTVAAVTGIVLLGLAGAGILWFGRT